MENVPPLWQHSLTTLLRHNPTSDPGMDVRQWVQFQGVHNILDLLSWDQEELKVTPAQQVYCLDDHTHGLYLRTNQIKLICGLITYMNHLFESHTTQALSLRMIHFIPSHLMIGPNKPQHKYRPT